MPHRNCPGHTLLIWVDIYLMAAGLRFEKRSEVIQQLRAENPDWDWQRKISEEEWNSGPHRKAVSVRTE